MNRICKYAKKSAGKLDIPLKERKELELQFIDHMTELYNNYKYEGYSEEEATLKAINTFKEDDFNIIDNSKKISMLLYFLFGLYIVGFAIIYFYASFRFDFFHKRIGISWLIPFKHIFLNLMRALKNNSMSIEFLIAQLLFFISFIPLGAFIPILISKYNSFADNFKIYLFIAIILQLIKIPIGHGIVCIDYIIIGILGTLIGYALLKIIRITILKVNTNKIIN